MSFRAATCFMLASLALACSGPVETRDSKAQTITLEDGHRFLERIEGNRVVLKRSLSPTRKLPFDEKSFVGKNIVIHPSSVWKNAGDEGIFARVERVEPAKTTLTLIVRPLQLDEMAQAAKNGNDTLTIDRNPSLRELPSAIGSVVLPSTGNVATQSLGLTLSPLAESSDGPTVEWPPTLGSAIGFTSNLTGSASATFSDTNFSFTPGLSAKWLDNGLQLGADLKLSARFKAALKATATLGAPVYETVEDQQMLVLMKGGPVTLVEAPVLVGGVYTTIGVKGSIACYVRAEEKVSGTLEVDLGATISGSAAVRITKESDDQSYVSEGDIPFAATGHATGNFVADDSEFSASVFCEVPRLVVYVQPGGRIAETLGGPNVYAGVAGRFTAAWGSDPSFKVQAIVGVSAKPFGRSIGAETALLTWTP